MNIALFNTKNYVERKRIMQVQYKENNMNKSLFNLKSNYQIGKFDNNFINIKHYIESNSIEGIIVQSKANYDKYKNQNYRIYKRARLAEYIKYKKYADIFFHLVLRRVKPISRRILEAKGFESVEEYMGGKAFYYQFELFSRSTSLDMEKIGNSEIALMDIKKNFRKYENLYHKLDDDKSKNVLNAIIMARLLKDPMYYFPINDHDYQKAYFDKSLIQCTKDEVFVDGGGVYWRHGAGIC